MTIEEALELVEKALDNRCLNNVQEVMFRKSWEGQSYDKIAEASSYDPGYIKDVGSKLWPISAYRLLAWKQENPKSDRLE